MEKKNQFVTSRKNSYPDDSGKRLNLTFELETLLTDQIYTNKLLKDQKYHMVNYWDKQGYLLGKRDKSSKWRRFSFTEYVWLQLLQELSEMNVAPEFVAETLKNSYGIPNPGYTPAVLNLTDEEMKDLPKPIDEQTHRMFAKSLADSLLERDPFLIRIYTDGTCQEIWGKTKTDSALIISLVDQEQNRDWESYIQVSITHILCMALLTRKFDSILVEKVLTPNEAELLNHINNNDLTTLRIQPDEGQTLSIDFAEADRLKGVRWLVDYLLAGNYQEIHYETHGGKIASFKNGHKPKGNRSKRENYMDLEGPD